MNAKTLQSLSLKKDRIRQTISSNIVEVGNAQDLVKSDLIGEMKGRDQTLD